MIQSWITNYSAFPNTTQRCNHGEIFGATSAMVGQNLPPGWNRVTISEHLGVTVVTVVEPKFSDTLTLFQPWGGRFCPPLQRLHQNFSCGYISAVYVQIIENVCWVVIQFWHFISKKLKKWGINSPCHKQNLNMTYLMVKTVYILWFSWNSIINWFLQLALAQVSLH